VLNGDRCGGDFESTEINQPRHSATIFFTIGGIKPRKQHMVCLSAVKDFDIDQWRPTF
jgi:hypothetical protein